MSRITPSELWRSPVILARLRQEAAFECAWGVPPEDKQHYWAVVPHADSGDGLLTLRNYEKSLRNCDPHELQQALAITLMKNLMKESSFDGLWLVGFTHPPSTYGVITDTENCFGRLIAIWHDEEGDPQYTVESDMPFMQMMDRGDLYYVGLCTKGHEQWKQMYGKKAMKSDFMLKSGQIKNAAMEALKK